MPIKKKNLKTSNEKIGRGKESEFLGYRVYYLMVSWHLTNDSAQHFVACVFYFRTAKRNVAASVAGVYLKWTNKSSLKILFNKLNKDE